MKRAKIVATWGPALAGYEHTKAAIAAGVNVARMNLSHGDRSVHEEVYANIRKAADELRKPLKVTFLGGENGDIQEEAVDEGALATL